MKYYIIINKYEFNSKISILRGAIFNTKQEAEKVIEFEKAKSQAINDLAKKIYGDFTTLSPLKSKVISINIPDNFLINKT